jgi:hypothetical protein
MARDSGAGRVTRAGQAAWRSARAAWPALRRTLAGLVLASWLALYGFWLISGDQPVCQVTTVTQAGPDRRVTTTRSCTLPAVSSYVYVLAVAVVLLLPDVQRLKIGNLFEFQRLTQLADAVQVTEQVRRGDTPRDSIDASAVIDEMLGDGA